MQIREQGWECPKCGRVWAPKIGACGWCNHAANQSQISQRPKLVQPLLNFPEFYDLSYRHQDGDPA